MRKKRTYSSDRPFKLINYTEEIKNFQFYLPIGTLPIHRNFRQCHQISRV